MTGQERSTRRAATVLAFGEVLIRLSPPGVERFFQTPHLQVHFGGSEANVAIALAHLGHSTRMLTRLPANPVGDAALAALRAEGVDVGAIVRGGERTGLYFVETGLGVRPGRVVYDRSGSSMAAISAGDLAWDRALDGVDWVHTSGITPALSEGARAATAELLERSRAAGLAASFDLNYRSKLWSPEQARAAIPPLLRGLALLIANQEHLAICLGVEVETGSDEQSPDLEAWARAARRVTDEHGIARLAITLREGRSASEQTVEALLYDRRSDRLRRSRRHRVEVADRIGGGDAFAAGLIHGLTSGSDLQEALELGVAAGALKHTVPGDFNRVTAEEIERLARGEATGRVER